MTPLSFALSPLSSTANCPRWFRKPLRFVEVVTSGAMVTMRSACERGEMGGGGQRKRYRTYQLTVALGELEQALPERGLGGILVPRRNELAELRHIDLGALQVARLAPRLVAVAVERGRLHDAPGERALPLGVEAREGLPLFTLRKEGEREQGRHGFDSLAISHLGHAVLRLQPVHLRLVQECSVVVLVPARLQPVPLDGVRDERDGAVGDGLRVRETLRDGLLRACEVSKRSERANGES